MDIYTPSKDNYANLPVIVFIHGGCLLYGDSHIDGYAPNEDITKELNAVMVSIQYRYGISQSLGKHLLGENLAEIELHLVDANGLLRACQSYFIKKLREGKHI